MENNVVVNEPVVTEPVVEPVVEPAAEPTTDPVTPDTDPSFAASQDPVVEPEPTVDPEPVAEPAIDPVVDPEPVVDPAPAAEPATTDPEPAPAPSIEEQFTALQQELEAERAEHSALAEQYTLLLSQYNTLEAAHAELVEFKRQSDDAKKDEMIGKFYMLSDEDKADVVANKANYSVEDIEEKLSVICFRKKVNFDLEDNSKNNNKVEQPAVTFNMSNLGATKPDWLIAVDNAKNKNN